jgi:hypothetical protein
VQTMTQYLLRDEPLGFGANTTTYASGLEFLSGKQKPSFAAYRLPIWMPNQHRQRGRALEVWGCVRPAKGYPHGAAGSVLIQLNGRTIRSVRITNPEGYFDVHVSFPHSGSVRLAWTYPHGARIYSRTVKIT